MNVFIKSLICAAGVISFASPASATVINFEEFPADNTNGTIPAARYAGLGVTFEGTDDSSTWGGLGAGNPGTWGVQGTNGGTFAGFNGSSYSLLLLFDALTSSFSLDASRTSGSTDGTVTIQALLDGTLVGSSSQVLGGVNQWSTLSLTGSFNQVRITGTGTGFHPFAIDNIVFSGGAVPEPGTWAMMLLGFGMLGFAVRRSARQAPLKPRRA